MRRKRAAWRSPPKPKPTPKPAPKRERVELVGGAIYWSDDNWTTIWRYYRRPAGRHGVRHEDVPQRVTDKAEADRVRYIAVIQYGGGRDDGA